MRRVFLFVLAAGAVLLIVAFLLVGAFPPRIVPHEVSRPIPTAGLAAPAGGVSNSAAPPAVVLPPIPTAPRPGGGGAAPGASTAPAAPGTAPPR